MLFAVPAHLFIFNLCIGFFLGVVFYRADYCMAAMFRDIFLIKDYTLLRSFFLLSVFGMAFFYTARAAGLVLFYPPPQYDHPSLMNAVGGVVFGMGMVMAGGCVVGTLYKAAGGHLTNVIAFGGIILGSTAYAELHPYFELLRRKTIIVKYVLVSDIASDVEFPLVLCIVVVSFFIFLKWKSQGKWRVTSYARGYLQPYKAAILISLLNLSAYIFSGWPIGVTTLYAKAAGYLEKMLAPAHLDRLTYFKEDTFHAELQGTVITGGAGPKVDIISFTELPLVIGIATGAFITAILLKEFKIYGLPPRRQALSAFAGGAILAFGARIAGGCNVKFALGGVPLLAFQGFFFLVGLTAGAYLGTILLKRFVVRV
ncbi:MAG: YeeE/YedE family protein [Desulfobacteraceae bacterium]|nr:MAG: YeeE/YedE family protein [Desulfobacteraceae bacterium]